jgi:hypothetical protein
MAIRAKILDLFRGNADYRKPLSEPIKMVDFMRELGFVLELGIDVMKTGGTTCVGTWVDGVECPVLNFQTPILRSGGQQEKFYYKVSVPPYDKYFTAGQHSILIRTGTASMFGFLPFWTRKYVWEDEKYYTYTITGTKEVD